MTPSKTARTDPIELIKDQNTVIAIIVHKGYHQEGISFVTQPDGLLQMGYFSHPVGHKINPHVHQPSPRNTLGTQEVLFIKSGKLRVSFFSETQDYLESRDLSTGDWIVLLAGGHGFEMLEPTSMIEIKNGPYAGEMDKVRFEFGEKT